MDGVLDLRGRGLRQGQREDRRRRDPQDAQAKCRGSQRGPPPGRQGGGVRPHGAHRRRRGGGRGQDGTAEGTVEIHRGRDRGVLEAAACRSGGGRRGPQVALQAPSGRALSLESAPSPVNPETLLALALVAVYVADSAHFLAIGEALIRTRSGRIAGLSFGWPFELAGRRPFIPNPLTPFWPELRLVWTPSSAGGAGPAEAVSAEMRAHLAAVRPVAWIARVC